MTTSQHDLTRITIEMPEQEHKKLKAIAAFLGISLKELVLNCLMDNLLSKNKLNAKTLKAIKETEHRVGLTECEDFNDFIDKLGLK